MRFDFFFYNCFQYSQEWIIDLTLIKFKVYYIVIVTITVRSGSRILFYSGWGYYIVIAVTYTVGSGSKILFQSGWGYYD